MAALRGNIVVYQSIIIFFNYHLFRRVVNVSSRVSHMSAKKCSDDLKAKFMDPNITVREVEQLMTDFVR